MATEQDHTLLQYARFYGIAVSSTDPLSYLDEECKLKPRATLPAKDQEPSLTALSGAVRVQLERDIEIEKLDVSCQDAHFLSTVIRYGRTNDELRWKEVLPPIRRIDTLKLETPLLTADAEFALASSTSRIAFELDVMQLLSTENPRRELDSSEMSERLLEDLSQCEAQLMWEKLHCSRESLVFIPRETRQGDPRAGTENALSEHNNLFLEPCPFDNAYSNDRAQSLPSPVTPDNLKRHAQHEVSSECQIVRAQSPVIRTPIRDADVEMECSTTRGLPTSEQCNGSKDVATPKDILLGDPISDQDYKAHSESDALQHRNTLNLVYIAQAALEAGEANCQGEGSGITKSMAISTPISSDQNPISMVDRPVSPHAITGSTELQGIPDHGLAAQQDQPQGLHANLEMGTAHDPIEIESDEEIHHKGRITSSPPGDPTARSTRTGKDDVILVEMPVHTLGDEPVQRDSKAANSISKYSVKTKGRSFDSSLPSGDQRIPTRLCRDDSVLTTGSTTLELGSLSRFMETRGISKRKRSLTSRYFANSMEQQSQTQLTRRPLTPSPQLPQIHTSPEPSITMADFAFPQSIGCTQEEVEQLLLFLSPTLLKTHIRLVQLLETRAHPPTIFYRDYDQAERSHPELSSKGHAGIMPAKEPQRLPGTHHEADVIISPTTGIILTTSHAVTQLYLPGHGPSNPTLKTIKGIKSPFRERIYQIVPRYEQIYILICHAGAPGSQRRSDEPAESTIDRRTIKSLASLAAFCASLSEETTITPLIIPSSPQSQAEWVLALACKHTSQLPATLYSKQQDSISSSAENNTTIGQHQHVLHEDETRWELFLRSMGLNPFAARVVLDAVPARGSEPSHDYDEDRTSSFLRSRETEPSILSAFIEMSPEDREKQFVEWLGCRVLKRLESVIDAHWQCDWAV